MILEIQHGICHHEDIIKGGIRNRGCNTYNSLKQEEHTFLFHNHVYENGNAYLLLE